MRSMHIKETKLIVYYMKVQDPIFHPSSLCKKQINMGSMPPTPLLCSAHLSGWCSNIPKKRAKKKVVAGERYKKHFRQSWLKNIHMCVWR